MAPRTIDVTDMSGLAKGAAVLGTGGGGDPYIGRLLAEESLRTNGPVEIVDLVELPDEATVVTVGMMGAPTVMVEKLPTVEQLHRALEVVEAHLGRRVTHVACPEAGGINSTLGFVAAARLRLPVVDADLMGRAFPELQMAIPSIYGVSTTPMTVLDEKGNVGLLDTCDNTWAERLARSATIEMGCAAIITLYPMTGAQARESLVPATLSLCLAIGQAIDEARRLHADAVEAVSAALNGRRVFEGKVVDVSRRTEGGFAKGEALLEGSGSHISQTARLKFQNEHLVAEVDGEAVVTTPDLIMVLNRDSGEPITTEGMRYGARVVVLGSPADPRWHSNAGIAMVGPRYFGYETDPVRLMSSS